MASRYPKSRRPDLRLRQLERRLVRALLATPIHEAGHLVAALLLGSDRPHRASVEWSENASGHIWSGETASAKENAQFVRELLRSQPASRSHLRHRAELLVQVDLAGAVAEELLLERAPRDGGGKQDRKNADYRLQPFITSRSERRSRLRLLRTRLTKLLGKPRAIEAILFVHDELIERQTIFDRELSALMERVEKTIKSLMPPLPGTKEQRARLRRRMTTLGYQGASSSA